jgi:hypothetical protein
MAAFPRISRRFFRHRTRSSDWISCKWRGTAHLQIKAVPRQFCDRAVDTEPKSEDQPSEKPDTFHKNATADDMKWQMPSAASRPNLCGDSPFPPLQVALSDVGPSTRHISIEAHWITFWAQYRSNSDAMGRQVVAKYLTPIGDAEVCFRSSRSLISCQKQLVGMSFRVFPVRLLRSAHQF